MFDMILLEEVAKTIKRKNKSSKVIPSKITESKEKPKG